MSTIWQKGAALLAAYIGVMAVYAGGQVLLGQQKSYNVLSWLPLYNYTAGLLTIVVAILLWFGRRFARWIALATLAVHAAVLLLLQTAYGGVVAPASIRAMLIRLAVWLGVMILLGIQLLWDRRRKVADAPDHGRVATGV